MAVIGGLTLVVLGVAIEAAGATTTLYGYSKSLYVLAGGWWLIALVHWLFSHYRDTNGGRAGKVVVPAATLDPSADDDPYSEKLARSLARQRALVHKHYADLEEIIGPRPNPSSPTTASAFGMTTYRGRVLDRESGAPVVGVLVSADRELSRTAWTDDEGHWAISLPAQRVWPLVFSHPGYKPSFSNVEPDRSSVHLVVRLMRGA
ncbi:MAG TPA: carboxypeptidase-like regulatory domain-containing protein [Candidatus Limnocylindria bacterium]